MKVDGVSLVKRREDIGLVVNHFKSILRVFNILLAKGRILINKIIIESKMATASTIIDHIFINKLFQHPTFQSNLKRSLNSQKQSINQPQNNHLSSLIEDVSSLLVQQATVSIDKSYKVMQQQIKTLRHQVEKIKELHISQITKADYFGKQISEDINFEDDLLFDMPSIKRTINSLHEKMKEISLNSSAILDNSQLLRESRIKEDFIQQKISCEITKIQQSFSHQQGHLQEIINKKIEKQQKTINNILQTLNELHTPAKADKNTGLLSSSKSATKLKTFFGFG